MSGSLMNRKLVRGVVFSLSALALAGAALAQSKDLPKAEEIIEKYIEATGGRAAYEKIKNRVTRATIEIPAQGLKGNITLTEGPPNLQRVVMNIEGIGKIENGFDGQVAYETSQMRGPRLMEGDEKAAAARQSVFNLALHLKDVYPSIKVIGEEVLDKRPTWKLELTPKDGKPEYWYFDKETGLHMRMDMKAMTQMGELDSQSMMSEYRRVDGLMLPHQTNQKISTLEQIIRVESVAHNTELPKDAFDAPKDVKELVAKGSATRPAQSKPAESQPARKP